MPKVVSRDEWVEARKEHLRREKELTRLRDELSRERRELPWERVEKRYVFEGPSGNETLADLFRNKHQLIVYHFMLGPGWKEGCPSCSYLADHFDGPTVHLAQRDVSFAFVSRRAAFSPKKVRVQVCFIRTRAGRCFIPTRLTRADSTCSSARIISWTLRRRGATKRA